MQYILTEEEYQQLKNTKVQVIRLEKQKLQKLCTKIANEWSSFRGWDDLGVPRPWGCILTEKYEHYCDECPVQSICPNENKHWSK